MEVNRKRIVVNTFLLYAKTLVTMAIAFISTRLVLEGLGVSDFGVYGTVGGAVVMLEGLNNAMSQATQRYMSYAEGKGGKELLTLIFNNTIIIHLGLGLAIVLLLAAFYFPLFSSVLDIPAERMQAAKYIYLFLAVSTFFSIITVPYDAVITAHESFLYYSIVSIVVALLKLAAALAVVYCLCDRLVLYGLLMAAITIVNMIIMRIYCRVKYEECHFAPRKYADKATIQEIGAFAGWNFVGAVSGRLGNHGSTILMNHFFGPILIAAKSIGDQLCSLVAILTSNMTKALNPAVVKSEGCGDRQTMLRLSLISCRFSFLLYLLPAIPFILNTEPLLRIWLKNVPQWAVLFCQLQVVRTLFEQFFVPLQMSLMAQGSIRQMNLCDLVFSAATFLILWGLYGAGLPAYWHYYVSILFLVFASGAVKVWLCRKNCGMSIADYVRSVVLPCAVVLLASCLVACLVQQLPVGVPMLVIVCMQMVALSAVALLIGLTRKEQTMLLSKATSYIKRHL